MQNEAERKILGKLQSPKYIKTKLNTLNLHETITLFFDRLKTRHLAADRESTSLFSLVEHSGDSVLFAEINLEPRKQPLWFCSILSPEKTPVLEVTTITESGAGALYRNQKRRLEQPNSVPISRVAQKLYSFWAGSHIL